MKYFTAALVLSGVAVASSNVTTEYVTVFTTYCPEATTITHGSSIITVSQATTLTLSCPDTCTFTRPVYSSSSVVCPSSIASATPSSSAIGSAPYGNGTVSTVSSSTFPTATGVLTTTTASAVSTAVPSGSANKALTASGASLAAALGFAAFFL